MRLSQNPSIFTPKIAGAAILRFALWYARRWTRSRCSVCSPSRQCSSATPSKAAAIGSCWRLPVRARTGPPTAFCRALGRLGWSRPSGLSSPSADGSSQAVEEGSRLALRRASSRLSYANSISIVPSSRSSAVPSPSTWSPSSHPHQRNPIESRAYSTSRPASRAPNATSPPWVVIVSVAGLQRSR
jgi:hypothetical protein